MSHGIIVKPLSFSTVTAEGSAAGTDPTYLGNDYIGVVHTGTGNPTGHVVASFGSSSEWDTVAFLSMNGLDGATQTITAGAFSSGSVQLNASHDTGKTRKNSFYRAAAVQTSTSVRADFAGLGAPFSAGRLVVGKALQFTRNFSFGMAPGVQDQGNVEFSKDGVLLRRYGRKLRRLDIQWSALTREEAEAQVLPLLELVGNTDPVLIVTDPDASDYLNSRMFFGWFVGNLQMPQQAYDVWQWRTTLLSVI